MRKVLPFLLSGLVMGLWSAGSAHAETVCAPRTVVLRIFAESYGPYVITSAHRQQSTTVEILHAASTDTWAVMGENYRGQTCVTVRQTNKRQDPLIVS